jgi:transposase-like protein
MYNEKTKTLLDVANNFNTQKKCVKHLEELYWPGEPVSPFDNSSKVYRCKNGRYQCKNTKKYFTVKTGTMFDNTKVNLPKWFLAIYLLTNEKKGISSVRLAKHINVSQKTAWYMLHRIRANFNIKFAEDEKFTGICEADETFVGGKNKNRHRDKKVEQSQGRSIKDKTPILGIIQRGDYDIVPRAHKQKPNVIVNEKIVHTYSQVRTKLFLILKGKVSSHLFMRMYQSIQ